MKEKISKKRLKEFGLLIGFIFPTIIGWLIPIFLGHSFRLWTLFIGITCLTFAITSPKLLFYPYKGWMALGLALGWINSKLILGLVYLIILQPIAILMKIFGYDPLRKKKSNQKSYREIKKDENFDFTKIF